MEKKSWIVFSEWGATENPYACTWQLNLSSREAFQDLKYDVFDDDGDQSHA